MNELGEENIVENHVRTGNNHTEKGWREGTTSRCVGF
jgi:hypothetical protein